MLRLLVWLVPAGLLLGALIVLPFTSSAVAEDLPKLSPTPVPYTKAVLKGKVTLAGDVPDQAKADAVFLETIEKTATRSDLPHLLRAPPEELKDQQWLVGKNKGLANVCILLKPKPGTFFAVDGKHPGVEAASKDAVLTGLANYRPRFLFVFPEYRDAKGKTAATGQRLVVRNDSPLGENVKASTGFNAPLASGAEQVLDLGKPSSEPINFSSSIHPWKFASVWVTDHPFYAVSDADGNYVIKNLPVGKVYVIAWHQRGGFLNKNGSKGQELELKEDGTVELNFTAKHKE